MYQATIKGNPDPFTKSKFSVEPATPDPFKATYIREKYTNEIPPKVNEYMPELWDPLKPLESRSPGKSKIKQKWTSKQHRFQLANRVKRPEGSLS